MDGSCISFNMASPRAQEEMQPLREICIFIGIIVFVSSDVRSIIVVECFFAGV